MLKKIPDNLLIFEKKTPDFLIFLDLKSARQTLLYLSIFFNFCFIILLICRVITQN